MTERRLDLIEIVENLFGLNTFAQGLFDDNTSLRDLRLFDFLEFSAKDLFGFLNGDFLVFDTIVASDSEPDFVDDVVDDENVLLLADRSDADNLDIIFLVLFISKDVVENLFKVVLFFDLFNFFEVFNIGLDFLDVSFFFLPQDVGLVLFIDHG